jgi:ADP-ribosylglycohydrolase
MLIGDALGVPYEFLDAEEIPKSSAIEMTPPAGLFARISSVPPGTWSDDGAQALCLLASLLERGQLDPDDLGQRFLRWLGKGYMAVDGHVFDIGFQTRRALGRIRDGIPALQAGETGEQGNGNGSLMRVLPLALWHRGTDEELVADAHKQSAVTHGHMRSRVCCALYCLWARRHLEEAESPWDAAVAALRQLYGTTGEARSELEKSIRPDDPTPGSGSGYVVDCLRSARDCMAAGNYEAVVKAAIALGNDTDTTACVAGGIAGVRDGSEAIPKRWHLQLRGKELYRPLLEQLLARG